LKLHDSLCKNFANDPAFARLDFPPKKIKYLMSEKELDERRDLLEAYLRCRVYLIIIIDWLAGVMQWNWKFWLQ